MTQAAGEQARPPARLLVVDDDDDTRRLLTRQLSAYYHVAEAADGASALAIACQTLPDLIVADIMMPGLDGFGLLKGLRENPMTRATPVIFISALSDESSRVAGIEAGANDYLVKPFSMRELRARINVLLELVRQREAAALREKEWLTRLQRLAAASLLINSNLSVEGVLQKVTEQAREIIGAHLAATRVISNEGWAHSQSTVALSDKYARWRSYEAPLDGSGIYTQVCRTNQPMRLTQRELEAHPAWRGFGKEADRHPPLRDWLAAPLVTRNGKNQGLIQLSDKVGGEEFTEEDEAVLVQIAQFASVALENARLYDAEAQARREAEAANALKLQFLAMISHELRTPLTSIKGFATTLLASDISFDVESQREFVDIINAEAEKLTNLIEQLLDLSGLQGGTLRIDPEPHSVSDILTAAAPQLQILAAHHELVIDTPPDLPPVLADPQRIGQVLSNLVGNATKFAPPGSTISIVARDNIDHVIIDVIDQGPGIPPDARDYIFEAFRQIENGRRVQEGSGLGLAICKGLVNQHGGEIWVDAEYEGGTKISFTLPVAEDISLLDDQ